MCMSWTEQQLRDALNDYEAELRAAGKARNTVSTYVQHPERFINWLVGSYRPRPAPSQSTARAGRSSVYDPLRELLQDREDGTVPMTFSEIEEVLGRPLPASARRHRPWWANERHGTHTHAQAWLEAGRRTENVDMDLETVEFVRG